VAAWKTPEHLEDHFDLHGAELGCKTLEEYDASAQATLAVGTYFTYFDDDSDEEHTGCYDRLTGRFVALDPDGLIVTHFACDVRYVRGLLYSNYDE
jgi:hypothetical protein